MQACGGNLVSQICEQQSVSLLHGSPLPLQAIVISIATNMMAMTNNKIHMDNCRAFGDSIFCFLTITIRFFFIFQACMQ